MEHLSSAKDWTEAARYQGAIMEIQDLAAAIFTHLGIDDPDVRITLLSETLYEGVPTTTVLDDAAVDARTV